jgi:hypothetical protein
MKTRSLAVYAGANPFYIAVIADLTRRARAEGETIVFLDLSRIVGPVRPHPNVREVIERAGGEYLLADRSEEDRQSRTFPRGAKDPTGIVADSLMSSVRSALITEFRDELPECDPRWSERSLELRMEAMCVARLVAAHLHENPSIGTVHVPNGRFPYQAATAQVATGLDRTVRFFELGESGSTTYFHEDYQTLDYTRTQDAVLERISKGVSSEAMESARDWFVSRSKGSGHIFGRAWGSTSSIAQRDSQKRAVIFTTSEDEYAELGDDWRPHHWESQWAAFDFAAGILLREGYEVTIRIHPNLASKSRRAYKRAIRNQERVARGRRGVQIVRHDDAVSSYSLVQESDIVLVWNSTLGLEAVANGKPVICMTAAYYDKVCSVTQWYSAHQIPLLERLMGEVDPESALRFRAALVGRDKVFMPESVKDFGYLSATADQSRIWRWARVEPILVAPDLWWDLIRNRRVSATCRILASWVRESAS